MITSFRCRCGRQGKVVPNADGTAECPSCGRIISARKLRTDRRTLWFAFATGITVIAIALVAVVVAANAKLRRARGDDVVRLEGPPTSQVAPPDTRTLPPAIAKSDSTDRAFVFDSLPDRPPVAPPSREARPPAAATPALPAAPGRGGELAAGPARAAGLYAVGDTVGQEVIVSRRSGFRVAGVEITQGSRYAFSSSLTVSKMNPDGSFVAEQTILNAKLLDADPDVRAPLAAALEQTKGIKFDLTVSPTGEVSALTGLKNPIRVRAGIDAALGDSLRVWSLLDADAWKELAGLTFFQPPRPPVAGAAWGRAAAHDWGPLGSWRGETTYTAGNQPGNGGVTRIDYTHDISYRPPGPEAERDLPLRVVKSDFKTVTAGGAIGYDPTTRRVTAAEETFRVRGAVLVSLDGIEAAVEMEELQTFKLMVTKPGAHDLVGPAPGRPR